MPASEQLLPGCAVIEALGDSVTLLTITPVNLCTTS